MDREQAMASPSLDTSDGRFLLAHATQKGTIELLAEKGASGHEVIEHRLDRWDEPSLFCLLQNAQAAKVGDSMLLGYSPSFPLIYEERSLKRSGQGQRFPFAKVEFLRSCGTKH